MDLPSATKYLFGTVNSVAARSIADRKRYFVDRADSKVRIIVLRTYVPRDYARPMDG